MVGASGGIRGRVLFLAGVSLVALAVGIALQSARAADRPANPPGRTSVALLLRLHDLPPGYGALHFLEGSIPGVICDLIDPGKPQPKVTAFVDRFSPAGCFTLYYRVYRAPGAKPVPLLAGTGALDAGSTEAAEAGFAVAAELLSHLIDDEMPEEVAPPEPIGDATRLFHWKDADVLGFGAAARFGSFLVWRSGNVLAVLFASGPSFAASDGAATALAHLQQAHIEHPTPYIPAERDDIEVPLDDPSLNFPVLWLGRTFTPRHGLHSAQLVAAFAGRGPRRSPKLHLEYTRDIVLDSWSEAGWNAKANGPRRWSWRCTVSRDLALPGGRAVLYGSYGKNLAKCPQRPPRHFSAVVHSHGMATVIGIQDCATCVGQTTASGEYNSFRGLAAIARGLQVRLRTH